MSVFNLITRIGQHRLSILPKLLILSLGIAIIPMAVVAFLNIHRGLQGIEQTAKRNLQLVAQVTATQLDQLLLDTIRFQRALSTEECLVEICTVTPDQRPSHLPPLHRRLQQILESNPDIASVFVADANGIGLAGTNPSNVGMDFKFRQYMIQALQGHTFISDWTVGKTSSEAGVYISGPIRDLQNKIVGAAVIKLQGHAIQRVLESVQLDGATGLVSLVDRNGIILCHPNPAALYHSLGTLTPDEIKAINPELQYGRSEIKSLGAEPLAQQVRRADRPGSVVFTGIEGESRIGGYAPLQQRPWVVAMAVPRQEFEQPMRMLAWEQSISAFGVGLIAVVVAFVASRRLVKPLQNLRHAAHRVAEGDWSARAVISSQDEIADVARSFNQMVPKLQERAQMEDSLRLAKEIQRNLLPHGSPQIAGLDVAGMNTPADQTGGDYYDFLDLTTWREGTLAVAIGDVTGHGVSAALLMATARALLRSRATPPGSLSDLLADVNDRLCEDTPDERFMTLMYALIDRRHMQVHLVSAGHDPIIIYDPAKDAFREFDGNDIPLGIERNWQFTERQYCDLAEGSILVFGTDGIWETHNDRGEMFGKTRLRELIRANTSKSAYELSSLVIDAIKNFRQSRPQEDDVTVVVVRLTPMS